MLPPRREFLRFSQRKAVKLIEKERKKRKKRRTPFNGGAYTTFTPLDTKIDSADKYSFQIHTHRQRHTDTRVYMQVI